MHRAHVPMNPDVFDGYAPGGESVYGTVHLAPTAPYPVGLEYFRSFIYNDTNWDWQSLTYADAVFFDEINPGQVMATSPDLTGFTAHGGKLLHYMGWGDPDISPGHSVCCSLDSVSFGLDELSFFPVAALLPHRFTIHEPEQQGFHRRLLPVVSCAGHVALLVSPSSLLQGDFVTLILNLSGGDGANVFGAADSSWTTPPLSRDADHSALLAMVRWVEQGIAPDMITAVKYNNDDAREGVNFTRPLCPYPKEITYSGSGDIWNATNFSCE